MLVGITGGTGLVGKALVERHLAAGDAVRCLTRHADAGHPPGVQALDGDLLQPDDRLVRFADGLDLLYHCAGEVADESRMRALNVGGTRALVTAAAGRIGRWIQLSSVGVYGRRSSGVVSEESALAPRSTYETTKAEADAIVLAARSRGLVQSAVVLRPSIVFGPGMPNRSILQMIRLIERGCFFFVGRRGASANYVHVANVAEALVLCGRAPGADGRVYNLSDWCTIEDFVGAIAQALGRPRPRLRLPERPVRAAVTALSRLAVLPLTDSRIDALVTRCRYSIDRIQQELQYAHRLSIAAGLAGLVAWKAAR
jgi:nucleoside-diphosphate-sugar epimerase